MDKNEDIAIGIDLGTTNCCVAVISNGQAITIPNTSSFSTTPSYVSFENGEVTVGEQAKDDEHTNPERTIYAIKRIIGKRFDEEEVVINKKRWPFKVVPDENGFAAVQLPAGCMTKTVWKPEEISAEVMKYLKQTAEDFLTHPVHKAVITVPANFTERQRKLTHTAGTLAGLDVIGIINEPTAAAVAYGLQSQDKSTTEKTILVCDFGGGTLDVSIIKAANHSKFEVICTAGNMHLGGEDFDQRILQHFIFEFEKENGPGIKDSASSLVRLRKQVETAKRALSTPGKDKVTIAINSLFNSIDFKATLTRETFEDICSDLIDKVLEPIEMALNKAKMSRTDISHVVLVGGSSRIPKVRELVQNYFIDQPIFKDIHPDEAIAIGAAVMAQSSGQVIVADVTSMSLGTRLADDSMAVILPQFSPIPSSATKKFTTASHFQTCAAIEVYEGENVDATKNLLWGTLQMTQIEPDLMGVPSIAVTYSYDKFGILRVVAEEEGTANKVNVEINISKDRIRAQ